MDWGDFWSSFLTIVVISHHLPYFLPKGLPLSLNFLENAVKAGLSFYMAEKVYQVGIPAIIVSDIKQAMSLIAQAFYQHPQDKLKLLAFTGTKENNSSLLCLQYSQSKIINLLCFQPWTTLDRKKLLQVYLNNTWEFGPFPYDGWSYC